MLRSKLPSCLRALLVPLLVLLAAAAHADPAPFDLTGPVLTVNVTRGAKTLPLSQVPELAAGDKLAIRANLPADQSAHYLMVVTFLRGATNPPPPEWFIRCETWKAPCAGHGLDVQVPQEAQQVLVLLAPTATGDFKTLVGAVRGRPGAFVRASQDLNQATLDRSRLDRYLTDLRALDGDAARLRLAAPLLARSLAVKVDEKCLDRQPSLQIPCLMQDRNTLVLDDGHSTTIVNAITGGPLGNLALDASLTPQASYGYYSPYVASVLDIARIFDSFRTAQYQYIPALASLRAERVQLSLNAPPSFHNPKSVLVAALPAVEPPQLPPLHAVDPKEIFCAARSSLVLPVEGAPLVFSTAYAHDLALRLKSAGGKTLELPARADAEKGGFVVDTAAVAGANLGDSIHGRLHGMWGFAPYEGPSFQLVNSRAQSWAPANKDETVVVGRDSTLHLTAASVSCVDSIMVRDPAGKELKTEWKPVKPDELEVKLPLAGATPGKLTLLVSRYGATEPQPVDVPAFAEAARLDRFALHAGDAQGVLHGQRLDEVAALTVHGVSFQPGALTRNKGSDELEMSADPQAAAALTAADDRAHVTLKDGRSLDIAASIEAPRPHAALIGRNVQAQAANESHIRLGTQDDLPQEAVLTFSVRLAAPASFTRESRIEVGTLDSAYSTILSLGAGLTLGDAHVAVARLEPAKAFGPAAFGQLRFRVLLGEAAGDWQPLVKLVRLPVLRELTCPEAPELACKLTGMNLFLLAAVAGNSQFEHAVEVPDGFPDLALSVPHPASGHIFVKLRDDPASVHQAAVVAHTLPPPEPPHPAPESTPAPATPQHPAAAAAPAPAAQEHPAEHPPAAGHEGEDPPSRTQQE